jgi:hypothetical protein
MSVLQDPAAGGAGDEASSEVGLDISEYDGLTVAQVIPRLAALGVGELRRLADHERRHGNRQPVLDAIDRALG